MGVDDAGLAKLGIRNNLTTLLPLPIDAPRENLIGSHNDIVAQVNTNTTATKTNAASISTLQTAATVEDWHVPTLVNGWINFDTTGDYSNFKYKKLPSGLVVLEGLANGQNKSGNIMFYLPVGYRPVRRLLFPTLANDAVARIDVGVDGGVEYQPNISGSVQSPNWANISGVVFWAEQ